MPQSVFRHRCKFIGICPSRKVIPSCTARSFRIRCYNSDAVFNKVAPILDIFRIAFSYKEYDCWSVRWTVFVKFIYPAVLYKSCVLYCLYVIFKCKRYNVCLVSVCNFKCLLTAAAVWLYNFNVLSCLPLPILCESSLYALYNSLVGRMIRSLS